MTQARCFALVASILRPENDGKLPGVTLHGFHVRWLGISFAAVNTIYLVGGALMALSGLALVIGLRGVDRRYRREDRVAAEAARAAESAAVIPVAMSISMPA